MDSCYTVIIIITILVVAWFAVMCCAIAAYASLRSLSSTDPEIDKAKTGALAGFLISFFTVAISIATWVAMIVVKATSTDEEMMDPDAATKQVINASPSAKFVFGLGILVGFIILTASVATLICQIYLLQKMKTSKTYKTNSENKYIKRTVTASILTICGCVPVILLGVLTIIVPMYLWRKSSNLVPADSSPTLQEPGIASDPGELVSQY